MNTNNVGQKISALINDLHGQKITHARLYERIKSIIEWQTKRILSYKDSVEYEKGMTDGVLKHKQSVRFVFNQCETLGYTKKETIEEIRKLI